MIHLSRNSSSRIAGLLLSLLLSGSAFAQTPSPLGGGTGSGGAVASVFGRTGAVAATSGDYTVGQVTGAAPLASPALTGVPTAPTPATSDNSTTIATTAYVKAQGGAGAISLTGGNGILCTPSPITSTGSCASTLTLNAQSGTSYATLAADGGSLVSGANSSAKVFTLPVASTTGYGVGFGLDYYDTGVGGLTLTATSSIFDNGLNSVVLATGQDASVYSDGANYHAALSLPLVPNNGFVGNNSGASNYPTALTQAQATALINSFTTSLAGLAPASGGGTTNFLRADGTWAAPPGGGTGCSVTGTQFQILAVNAAGTGCTPDTAATVNAGALALGSSGTLGTVAFGNATSGVITLSPPTGALGTVSAFLPLGGSIISSTTAIGVVSGTPSSTTYLRGDGTWATPSGSGSGTVNTGTTPNGAYYASSTTAVSDAGAATVSFGGINVTTTTVPALGIYQSATNTLGFTEGSSLKFIITSTAFSANNATGVALTNSTPTAILPDVIPNQGASTTGLGGVISVPAMIVGAASIESWASTGPSIQVLPTDATFTDNSLCINTTSHVVYSGSGTLGICLGTSSARYKHDIKTLAPSLDALMKLQPKSFYLNKDHGDPSKEYYGFIAEDVIKVLPKIVGLDKQKRPNTVDYVSLIPILVNALQEQQREIDVLKRQVRR